MKRLTLLPLALAAVLMLPAQAEKAAEKPEDTFYWIGQINKASLIINSEEGLLDKKFTQSFAQGLQHVLDSEGDGKRPQTVIAFEPYLIEAAGAEITRLHAGRSSQDMLSSARFAMLRQDLLDLARALDSVNASILELANAQRNTIIPAYTNGVVAQPTSYGHYLQAFGEGFMRDSDRLQAFYARVNRSPMGSTVLNGTSWPLNRERMADYLGFNGLAYNTYDATQIFTLEYPAETAALTTSISLHVGNFIEDVMQQYAQPRPWILLQEGGANTYVSSAMPQKRNPGILTRTRTLASTIIGDGTGAVLRAHNIPPGMADPRSPEVNKMVRDTIKLLNDFNDILHALVISPERALEELNLDWTASQEVADVLMRQHNLPFRIGHHVASDMVSYARENNLTPLTFPYEEAQRIYREGIAAEELADVPEEFPMDEEEFKAALNPEAIIANRAVPGGPQATELDKMFADADKRLKAQQEWTEAQITTLQKARAQLDSDFDKLLAK